ncbi:hypothetical protein [uncultured Pseudokineococcus sp.]|uniref:hypothetical protein n=1 Tax=uncultured Pseudokineococcus sp. TaxID=1642928 RepID=UPI002628D782|nr:hypothetical protein [uncultured Pseudokineococcus sp.]
MVAVVPASALLVALVAGLLGAVARARRGAVVAGAETVEGRRAARRTLAWRWGGAVLGAVAAWSVAGAGTLGRGPMLAPAAFGLVLLAGVLAGELLVRPRRRGRRSAALSVRRVRDVVPRRTVALVVAAAVVLLVLLATTTALGSPDDLGRAGRSLTGSCSPSTSFGVGPWPGSYYAAPLAAAVLGGLLVAALVLGRVVGRPAVAEGEELERVDAALRARAGEAVTAACGVLVSAPLAGVLAITVMTGSHHDCPSAAGVAALVAAGVLVPASTALLGWCLAVLAVPGGALRTAAVPVRA